MSVVSLLDVNVLLALAWPNHVHHLRAHAWFRRNQQLGWATCPLTQSGFVRVSSNRLVIPEAVRPEEAVLLIRQIVALPCHVFWTDDTSLARPKFVVLAQIAGHHQVTDAHLVELARRHQGRLATLDRSVRDLVPKGVSPEEAVAVIA